MRFDRRRPAWSQNPDRVMADNVGTVDNPQSPVFQPEPEPETETARRCVCGAADFRRCKDALRRNGAQLAYDPEPGAADDPARFGPDRICRLCGEHDDNHRENLLGNPVCEAARLEQGGLG